MSPSPCCDLLLDLTPRPSEPHPHYLFQVKSTIWWALAAASNRSPLPSTKHRAAQLQTEQEGRSQQTTVTNGSSP